MECLVWCSISNNSNNNNNLHIQKNRHMIFGPISQAIHKNHRHQSTKTFSLQIHKVQANRICLSSFTWPMCVLWLTLTDRLMHDSIVIQSITIFGCVLFWYFFFVFSSAPLHFMTHSLSTQPCWIRLCQPFVSFVHIKRCTEKHN